MDQRVYLKVKIKSLAEEARIIRKEEKKPGRWRNGLYLHRVGEVRNEARAAQLAYGFLRGRTLEQLERHTKDDLYHWHYIKTRVQKLIERYGYRSDEWEPDSVRQPKKEAEQKRLQEWLSNRTCKELRSSA